MKTPHFSKITEPGHIRQDEKDDISKSSLKTKISLL